MALAVKMNRVEKHIRKKALQVGAGGVLCVLVDGWVGGGGGGGGFAGGSVVAAPAQCVNGTRGLGCDGTCGSGISVARADGELQQVCWQSGSSPTVPLPACMPQVTFYDELSLSQRQEKASSVQLASLAGATEQTVQG